jgi:hypothetical protein
MRTFMYLTGPSHDHHIPYTDNGACLLYGEWEELIVSSNLIRWGGLAAMVAGPLLIMAVFLSELVHDQFFYLIGLVMLLLLVALPALHTRQAGRSRRLGLVGFVLAMIGAAILTVLFAVVGVAEGLFGFDPDEADFLFLILVVGFFGFLIGIVLFGIDTARAGVLPRWSGALVALGLPLALVLDIITGAFFDGEEATPWGIYIGFPIFAIGLIWLGYALWLGRSAEEQSSRVR